MWVPGSESSLGVRTAVSQHTLWPGSVPGTPTAGSASQEQDLPWARLERPVAPTAIVSAAPVGVGRHGWEGGRWHVVDGEDSHHLKKGNRPSPM